MRRGRVELAHPPAGGADEGDAAAPLGVEAVLLGGQQGLDASATPGQLSFNGGTLPYIVWPDILPMWFNYRNPVSGRVPQFYQPDCTPCGMKPSWSMLQQGYQLPPNGPNVDGFEAFPE